MKNNGKIIVAFTAGVLVGAAVSIWLNTDGFVAYNKMKHPPKKRWDKEIDPSLDGGEKLTGLKEVFDEAISEAVKEDPEEYC